MENERLNPGQRLLRQRKVMRDAQQIKFTLDVMGKRWKQIIKEAYDLGLNLGRDGIVRAVDTHHKDVWEIINIRALSRKLAGGDLNITRKTIPDKYVTEVFEVAKAVEDALARVFKNRYAKNMREREWTSMNETLKKKKTRNVIRKNLIKKAEKGLNIYK